MTIKQLHSGISAKAPTILVALFIGISLLLTACGGDDTTPAASPTADTADEQTSNTESATTDDATGAQPTANDDAGFTPPDWAEDWMVFPAGLHDTFESSDPSIGEISFSGTLDTSGDEALLAIFNESKAMMEAGGYVLDGEFINPGNASFTAVQEGTGNWANVGALDFGNGTTQWSITIEIAQ